MTTNNDVCRSQHGLRRTIQSLQWPSLLAYVIQAKHIVRRSVQPLICLRSNCLVAVIRTSEVAVVRQTVAAVIIKMSDGIVLASKPLGSGLGICFAFWIAGMHIGSQSCGCCVVVDTIAASTCLQVLGCRLLFASYLNWRHLHG